MKEELIFLQNIDVWMEVIQLNTCTNAIMELKRYEGIKTSGHYAVINGETIMFYRKDKLLFINLGNNEICLDDSIDLSYERNEASIRFCIHSGNNVIYSVSYSSYRNDYINSSDFDFNSEKEEDYDFFLFVYNVVNNPKRRMIIYT